MEEVDFSRRDISEKSSKSTESRETSGDKEKRFGCYKKCMDDAWDLKGESTCASVCGV